ncbi:MAG TPA: ABC-F family ATP-binding cassette domain-containing protein [Acidimicrobiales bacterium]|jgi:ATPase subunit of ABC transporter with duplicated ATPase domains|nr:ABC-F family ATP-binding cassette domain-containing protein [Acidimicrobiales bacterium]
MTASLLARDLTLSFGEQLILDSVEVRLAGRDRVGVVGPNGTGKTTLLRVLAGLQVPDRGSVAPAPTTATIGYLPQEPERRADESVRTFLERRTGVTAAQRELEAAIRTIESDHDRYDLALQRWMALGGADLDARIGPVLDDLGLDDRVLDQDMTSLSGGQAARTSLGAILLSRYDVFLLDEPTNDLDFDGLARLEGFLEALPGAAMVVSHDRAFLERTITSVLELDERSHRSRSFAGGWLSYLEERATLRRHAEEAFDEYRDKRRALEERVRSQRQWAVQGVAKEKKNPKDNDKAQRDFRLNRTEKQAAKVRVSEKALERLDVVDKPWEGWQLQLRIATAPRSGAVVARLDGAVVRLGSFVLGPIDEEIGWAERVAILGPNGSGKTTLLGALLGRLPLAEGSQWLGPGVVVGEVDQARGLLTTDESLLDAFVAASGLISEQEARGLLAKFGLGADHVARTAASLSPGERTRAVLAMLMARGTNCLVLDEPTNHLDLQAIEQLEQALDTYDGTLLLVTHDRRLLDAVRIDRTIAVGGNPAGHGSDVSRRAQADT